MDGQLWAVESRYLDGERKDDWRVVSTHECRFDADECGQRLAAGRHKLSVRVAEYLRVERDGAR